MNLYDHQKRIIDVNLKKAGLFLGTGSGKTRIALMLARGSVLIIAPKTQVEDQNWERETQAIGSTLGIGFDKITTISKETFRRDHEKLPRFDTVIIDEAHTVAGVAPNVCYRNRIAYPKASQLFEAVEKYLKRTEPERLYLCTATPIRSPMTVWALARLLGKQWDFYRFREKFYVKLPMPGREVWTPRHDSASKNDLASYVRQIGYTGRLEDYFDVPEQTHKTITVELSHAQKNRLKTIAIEYPEPIARLTKIHQIENGTLTGDEFSLPEYFDNQKIDKIKELALEFPRMIIFAKYTLQINEIEKTLKDQYKVITMTGSTQNRGDVIARAAKASECIFVVQSQISAGWELPEYPVMVFASRTYSFVDYDQGIGRIQRAKNIKKNLYINLVVRGGVDEAVDMCIRNKKDFSERIYLGV